MNEFDLRAARGVYDPALTAGVFYDHGNPAIRAAQVAAIQ